MGCTPTVGDRHAGSQLPAQKLVGDLCHHWQLAALKVVGAFGIHDNAIDPVDGNNWRIDRQRPERDAFESDPIGFDIRVDHHQTAKQRLRLRRRHADMHASSSGSRVGSRNPSLGTASGNHGDRLFRRNGGICPPYSIRRQIRKINGYDPCHHTLSRETQHTHRFHAHQFQKPLRPAHPRTGSSSDGITLTRHLVG